MNIGSLAKASGVSAKLIRYYESIGLIPPAERSENNYRIYRTDDVHLLRFIKRSRSLGFGMSEIEVLLSLWQNKARASSQVKSLALTHIDSLERRIQEMQSMRDTLKELADHCHGDENSNCPILEDLAQGAINQ